jgi:phosphoribosylglycinamide formyltransferase 1
MNEVLKAHSFRRDVHSVIAAEPCAGIEKALAHDVATEVLGIDDNTEFCKRLLAYLQKHAIDYVFSFYTRFYTEAIRAAYRDRVINFHPSILPGFKGMDGFGDTIAYDARFVGSTVEFIDEVMDEGKIILQTAFPCDPAEPIDSLRHRLFVQQCKSMLQVSCWLQEGRIEVSGRKVTVKGARFDTPEFSPSLDSPEAIALAPMNSWGILLRNSG